ncbi:MAG: fatty acid desaturase, partial [Chitinophagales bacterium]
LIPYFLLPFSLGTILLGFVLFHFAASFTVALALISAHIGEDSVYPEPDAMGKMPTSWIRHQIVTTSDFATHNPVLTHLFGGFNHHVVHHLFPNICHIHYPQLTQILIQTCADYDMPYKSNPTLIRAIFSHWNFLKIRSLRGEKVEYIEM